MSIFNKEFGKVSKMTFIVFNNKGLLKKLEFKSVKQKNLELPIYEHFIQIGSHFRGKLIIEYTDNTKSILHPLHEYYNKYKITKPVKRFWLEP